MAGDAAVAGPRAAGGRAEGERAAGPETRRKTKRKQAARGLLDEALVAQTLVDTGLHSEAEASAYADKLVHTVFLHEAAQLRKKDAARKRKVEHEREGGAAVVVEQKELAAPDPIAAASVEQEFDVMQARQLPKTVREVFRDWRAMTSKIVHISESTDYVTTKLLIELETGNQVEAVVLRHNKRTTLCVSSQVGCKMGCTFCATGTLGQRANLTAGEIQEQVVHANRFLRSSKEPRMVTNIVFMGMGEPLNNYKSMVAACRAFSSTARFGMSPGKVTVSTVGVINRMKTLYQDVPGVSLALSLHAPNQELRQKIIPTAGAYPIPKLMQALQDYLDAVAERNRTLGVGGRKRCKSESSKEGMVMIEYILLSGVNDMPEIAEELAQLLEPLKTQVKVNLIPYNPIFNPEGLAKTFVPPSDDDVNAFKDVLQRKHGIFCTVRTEMGQDVNGACGQLACVSEVAKDTNVDIEDLYRSREVNQLYDTATGVNRKKRKGTARPNRRPASSSSSSSSAALSKHPASESPVVLGTLAALSVLALAAALYSASRHARTDSAR